MTTSPALRDQSCSGADSAKTRVAFIMPTEVGWETLYLNFREALTERDLGVEPTWVPIRWWREGGLLERLPLLPGGLKARIRSRLEVKEGLAQGPFDALFVGRGHMLHGGQSALERQPYFVNTDATLGQLYSFGDHYGIRPSRFAAYERRKQTGWRALYRGASALFPWSHWAAQGLMDEYRVEPERLHVIPPGVDVERWRSPRRTATERVNILFVGGNFHRKGGDLLLEWARRTASRGWVLHLVTRDDVTVDRPNVLVHQGLSPNDPHLLRLYRQADLFALPTRADCYSIAGVEAMAAGLPVILGRSGGTADVVKHGETGYLVDAEQPDTVYAALEKLVGDAELRLTMGDAARRDAEERYDSRRNVARTIEIIRSHLS